MTKRTTSSTPGRSALGALGLSGYRIAQRMGVSTDGVYQWLNGQRRPEPHLRLAIERIFGIPASDWLTAEERRIAFGGDEGGGSGAVEHGGGSSCAV